jgi:hypothetical protein
MNRDSTNPHQSRHSGQDELDRSLSRIFDGQTAKDSLLPSSGFTEHVMESVREDAVTPPPLRFPWKRALPPFGCALVILFYAFLRFVSELPHLSSPDHPETTLHLPSSIASFATPLGWIALALFVAFVSVAVCLRFASPRG